jgi:hypothetical protein
MFFDDPGAEIALDATRDPLWKTARRAHLKKQPWCIACLVQHRGMLAFIIRMFRRMTVHHIYPFHIVRALDRADLEFDPRNLVTLCGEHHRVLGHFDDWMCYNPHVKHLSVRFFGREIDDILGDPEWSRFRDERKRDLQFMSVQELLELRAKLDEKFPRRD